MEKNILRKMSYGIYIVSTMDSGRATGCAVNSAMQINVSPETVAISINRKKFHTPVHSRVWLVCNKFNCRGLKSNIDW
ncbi:MAG: flavin reductase [Eubacterium sp.]